MRVSQSISGLLWTCLHTSGWPQTHTNQPTGNATTLASSLVKTSKCLHYVMITFLAGSWSMCMSHLNSFLIPFPSSALLHPSLKILYIWTKSISLPPIVYIFPWYIIWVFHAKETTCYLKRKKKNSNKPSKTISGIFNKGKMQMCLLFSAAVAKHDTLNGLTQIFWPRYHAEMENRFYSAEANVCSIWNP